MMETERLSWLLIAAIQPLQVLKAVTGGSVGTGTSSLQQKLGGINSSPAVDRRRVIP